MKLTRKEIDGLMRLIGLTRDDEINCEQCLTLISEFAEKELSGKSVPEGLKAVEHHLNLCSECCEEYEVLKKALKNLDD